MTEHDSNYQEWFSKGDEDYLSAESLVKNKAEKAFRASGGIRDYITKEIK